VDDARFASEPKARGVGWEARDSNPDNVVQSRKK
jgi:hypothetical protein